MSTRAYIRISKEGECAVHFHHHCDGYPSGVGEDLVRLLKQYSGEWTPNLLGGFINEQDDDFRFIEKGPSWDHEYCYIIDCDKKTLSGYYKGITSSSVEEEIDYYLGDELLIRGNIFDGEPRGNDQSSDWSSFRREAAKDILAGMLSNPGSINVENKRPQTIEGFVNSAVMIADELIKQLQEIR